MTWHLTWPAHLRRILREWQHRAHSRREIVVLDDRTIGDLGISRSQIEFEAQKPFWRS